MCRRVAAQACVIGQDVSASGPRIVRSMFISPAYAQGAGGGSDFLIQLMPILLMFVIFYMLLLRPQQQRAKVHKEMVANIRRGDTVVTSGGIVGKVTKVKDDGEIEVEIAENTRVRVIRGTISEVRVKGEPVKESA
jgi:preprotein translocase subunit YajC